MEKDFLNGLETFHQQDFDKGYDPIIDFIDNIEGEKENDKEYSESQEQTELETEQLLIYLATLNPYSPDYEKIYVIDLYCNVFLYSANEGNLFWEEWVNWDGSTLQFGKSLKWFHYFVDRRIVEKIERAEDCGAEIQIHDNPFSTRNQVDTHEDINAKICEYIRNGGEA